MEITGGGFELAKEEIWTNIRTDPSLVDWSSATGILDVCQVAVHSGAAEVHYGLAHWTLSGVEFRGEGCKISYAITAKSNDAREWRCWSGGNRWLKERRSRRKGKKIGKGEVRISVPPPPKKRMTKMKKGNPSQSNFVTDTTSEIVVQQKMGYYYSTVKRD